MKWLDLHNRIGKQPIRNTRNSDVTVVVDGLEIVVTGLKFKTDGTPYLIAETESEKVSNNNNDTAAPPRN